MVEPSDITEPQMGEIPYDKEELATKTYRMVFLESGDYKLLNNGINNKEAYPGLTEKGVENFMMKDSGVVFIPDKYRYMLKQKAYKGQAL